MPFNRALKEKKFLIMVMKSTYKGTVILLILVIYFIAIG